MRTHPHPLSLKWLDLFGQESYFGWFVEQYTLFFYKNMVYKNIQAQIYPKIKNILRIKLSLNFSMGNKNFSSMSVSFWYKAIYIVYYNHIIYITHYYYTCQLWYIVLLRSATLNWYSYFISYKNILRIYSVSKWKILKNIEAQQKLRYSYKKKSVYIKVCM